METVIPENSVVNEFYESWDDADQEICPRCHGTGLDRWEEDDCEHCFGEGSTPVLSVLPGLTDPR